MRGRWDQIVRAVVHRPALAGEWLQDLRGDVLRPLSLASPCLEGLPLSKGERVGESRGAVGARGSSLLLTFTDTLSNFG